MAFLLLALLIPLYRIQISVDLSVSPELDCVSSDIKRAISDGKVILAGNALETALVVADRIKTAKEIYNTYIISETPYPKDVADTVESAIYAFAKRSDTLFEETCSELGKSRPNRLKDRFKGTLPESYRPRILKKELTGVPICNFIILRHGPSDPIPEEIFFGWGYFQGNSNESVFWSNDSHIIGFFRGYHKALRNNTISEPL